MSRVGNSPISIPAGVDINFAGGVVSVKGKNGELKHRINQVVQVGIEDNVLTVMPRTNTKRTSALLGTTRAVINNMVSGVSAGFEKKLTLVGIGYRAQVKGNSLNLTLGFSHPIEHSIPKEVTVETPSQTEIIIRGCDKQKVGQVAADIRSYRPPEPYKGKGVRYSDEIVVRKEAKKK